MTDKEISKANEIISGDLTAIKAMAIGSKERADAISDVSVLMRHSIDAAEAEAKVTDAKTKQLVVEKELDLKARELEIKKRELDLKAQEISQRAETDKDHVKADKRKMVIEVVCTTLKVGGSAAITALTLVATQRGWFVDKMAYGSAPKIRF